MSEHAPEPETLDSALRALVAAVERVGRATLARRDEQEAIERSLDGAFDRPRPDLARAVHAALEGAQVWSGHARYFGFPRGTPGVIAAHAAALAAVANPELATRQHAPFAVRAEERLAQLFGERLLGAEAASFGGALTSGASEGTTTALLAALMQRFPRFVKEGAASCSPPPRVYTSVDAHPSLQKALRAVGLGDRALRLVAADRDGRLKPESLATALGEDRGAVTPLFVAATFGTTTTGALDPIARVADLCDRQRLWLHVDAAYGGLLALASTPPADVGLLGRARSLVFDPPKSLPVPGGIGLLWLRPPELYEAIYSVPARYLPRSQGEPFARSPAWSRAFRGLPLLLTLADRGFAGFAEAIDKKLALADELRVRLTQAGFTLAANTPLPVVSFFDGTHPRGQGAAHLAALADSAKKRAGAYLPLVRLVSGAPVLRAAIVSDHTGSADLAALVEALVAGREQALPTEPPAGDDAASR